MSCVAVLQITIETSLNRSRDVCDHPAIPKAGRNAVRASTHVRRAASKGRQCRFRRRLGSRAALVISIASLYLLGSGEPGTAESSRSDTDVVSVTVQAEPVAIAANSAEAWVVGSAAGKSEQGQLIRIAMSGAVRSRPVLGAPTDVTATKSSILVAIDRDGAVPDHDEVADFDPVGMQTGRRASTINPTRLAEADGYIWVLSAGRTDGSSLLQRLDFTANSRSELRLRGGGRYASLGVGGGRVWVLTETRIAGRTRSIVTPVDASANQTLNFSIVVPGVGQDIAYARRNAWVSTMRRAKGRVWGEIRRIVPARQTAVLTESLPTVRALTVRGIGLWVVSGRNQVDQIDSRTGRALGHATFVAGTIDAVAVDGTNMWTLDRRRHRITRIRL
jgi:hypothetical protein